MKKILFIEIKTILSKALTIILDLVKIMVPILVLVKLLELFQMIYWLGNLLGPLMSLVGLPGSMGLVWATAMITNIYGGMAVFFTLAPTTDMTVAQTTIIGSLMLMSHNLLIEQKIISMTGIRFIPITLFRFSFSLLYGMLLSFYYQRTNTLQTPLDSFNLALTSESKKNTTLAELDSWSSISQEVLSWGQTTLTLLFSISTIIIGLVILLRILDLIKATDLIIKLLGYLLKPFKVENQLSHLATIGMILGLAYGGGLIINEVKTKQINKRGLFLVMAFLSICHSLIEDTLLIMAIGADLSGIFWGRILFSYLVVFILSKTISSSEPSFLNRWLFKTNS